MSLIAVFMHPPAKVYAHYLATGGSIEAVLHIEPDDNPVPGKSQVLHLIFSNSSSSFSVANCYCNMIILLQGQQLDAAHLTPPPSGQPTVYSTNGLPFTFPSPGTYHIAVTGRPVAAKSFTPFSLAWNIQVNPAPQGSSDFSATAFLAYFAAIAGILLITGLLVLLLG